MLAGWLLFAKISAGAAVPAAPVPIVVDDPRSLFVSPSAVETLAEPRWVLHTVRPREQLTRIAARYAVSVAQLRKWNDLDPNDGRPGRKRSLRVLAQRIPPPALQVIYVVKPGETWDDVAAKLRVSRRGLQTRHPRVHELVAGTRLLEWLDPIEGPSFEPDAPDIIDGTRVPTDARSVGRPNRGKLEHGARLADSPLWALAHPTRAFGSTHTLEITRTAFTSLRNDIGYRGAITIGALSRPHGGKFSPHLSHQSGRDLDIRLPLRAGLVDVRHPTADDIDWYAAWAIVDAFLRTGEVEAVFLEMGRQERLYTAARALGVDRSRLREVVRWPNWSGPESPIVRHSDGHDTHIHVRIRCGADEPRCRSGD
jgi:murein endopeptidase